MTLRHPIPRGFFGVSKNLPTGSHRVGSENLELAYDMEHFDGQGRMFDFSGNDRHGTVTGTIDTAGPYGQAREFDGDDSIDASGLPDVTAAITIGAFIRISTKTPTNDIPIAVAKDGAPASNLDVFRIRYSRIADTFQGELLIDASSVALTLLTSPVVGRWYRAIQTYDSVLGSNHFKGYIDGDLTAQSNAAFGSLDTTGQPFRIGHGFDGRFWEGGVDEPFAISRNLLPEGVKAISLDGRENLYVSSSDDDLGTVEPRRIA